MERTSKRSKFAAIGRLACVGLTLLAFGLSISLVRLRQDIIIVGRRVGELERNMASYASKNAELDAKILRLSSSRSLRALIATHGLVAAGANNTVRVPRTEAQFYAMNRPRGGFAVEKFPKQTNLMASR
jgi:cell division protein FtsL